MVNICIEIVFIHRCDAGHLKTVVTGTYLPEDQVMDWKFGDSFIDYCPYCGEVLPLQIVGLPPSL